MWSDWNAYTDEPDVHVSPNPLPAYGTSVFARWIQEYIHKYIFCVFLSDFRVHWWRAINHPPFRRSPVSSPKNNKTKHFPQFLIYTTVNNRYSIYLYITRVILYVDKRNNIWVRRRRSSTTCLREWTTQSPKTPTTYAVAVRRHHLPRTDRDCNHSNAIFAYNPIQPLTKCALFVSHTRDDACFPHTTPIRDPPLNHATLPTTHTHPPKPPPSQTSRIKPTRTKQQHTTATYLLQ